jgi:hypothetical protein
MAVQPKVLVLLGVLAASAMSWANAGEMSSVAVDRVRSKAAKVRQAAAEELLAERQRTLKALLVIAEAPGAKPESLEDLCDENSSPNLAISVLGEMRAPEAVPALINRLAFLDKIGGASLTHAFGVAEVPVAVALVKIGKPAEPAILKAIRQKGPSFFNMRVWILQEIEGAKMAVALLEDALATEKNEEAKANLAHARDIVLDFLKGPKWIPGKGVPVTPP